MACSIVCFVTTVMLKFIDMAKINFLMFHSGATSIPYTAVTCTSVTFCVTFKELTHPMCWLEE